MFFLYPYQAKFTGLVTIEELNEILKNNERVGVFQNKATNTMFLCTGICVNSNIFSKKTTQYLIGELRKNKSFFLSVVNTVCFNSFKSIVLKILNNNSPLRKFEDRIVQVYLRIYLEKLSENDLLEAIRILFNKILENIDFIFFTIHTGESECKMVYNIEEAPTIFTFVDGNFLDSGYQKTKTIIFKKSITIDSLEIFTKIIAEIMEKAFLYYINVVLNLSVVENTNK